MENYYTCQDCNCYFYESDAFVLRNGDKRELYCYYYSQDSYAKVLAKEKRSYFFRYVMHTIWLILGIIFMEIYAYGYANNNQKIIDIFVPPTAFCLAMALVWYIVNLIRELRKTNKFEYVGIPDYDVEEITRKEYSDGSKEEKIDYYYAYSVEQKAVIIKNTFTFFWTIIWMALFSWIKFLVYCIKYRKKLINYFKAKKKKKELEKDLYAYNAYILCETMRIGKEISIVINKQNDENPFIASRCILKDILVYEKYIYSCFEKDGKEYYAKILPGRKAILVEDSGLLTAITKISNRDRKRNDRHPFDMLLDENCTDNIVLLNDNEEPVELEQIATIPYNDEVYAILKPVVDIPEVADNEAFVFWLNYKNQTIVLVEDENLSNVIFEKYENL